MEERETDHMIQRRFRPPSASHGEVGPDLEPVMDLIDGVWLPVHFYIDSRLKLSWEFAPAVDVPWEMLKGRLLDSRQCLEAKPMARWAIFQNDGTQRSDEPVISILLDWQDRSLHVLRGIQVFAWEPNATSDWVEGTETRRWQREKVGTLLLSDYHDLEEVRDELICLLWQACVGTSRLPLTSVETPLPAFSFGMLYYAFRADLLSDKGDPVSARPMRTWKELLTGAWRQPMATAERTKLLEFLIRCCDREETPTQVAELPVDGQSFTQWMRRVFNDVSLSPYNDFVAKALATVQWLTDQGRLTTGDHLDFLAHLLRRVYRHLLAYDLVVFHHRGANYPDALLLEELLIRYAAALTVETTPNSLLKKGDWTSKPLQKHGEFEGPKGPVPFFQQAGSDEHVFALVLGCLLIQRYRDHAVPDAPTSVGEQARVMPEGFPRVPGEQIELPHLRRRRLFADWKWRERLGDDAISLLRDSKRLLTNDLYFLELGKAVFIDRPFGKNRPMLEPDQTMLLAHEAFSLALANASLMGWRMLLREFGDDDSDLATFRPRSLEELSLSGLPIEHIAPPDRPIPSLADASRVAPDFLVLRTMPGSVAAFLRKYAPLFVDEGVKTLDPFMIVRTSTSAGTVLLAIQKDGAAVEFEVDALGGFRTRAGLEFPRAGFRVLRNVRVELR